MLDWHLLLAVVVLLVMVGLLVYYAKNDQQYRGFSVRSILPSWLGRLGTNPRGMCRLD
jgi:hypothetical protein